MSGTLMRTLLLGYLLNSDPAAGGGGGAPGAPPAPAPGAPPVPAPSPAPAPAPGVPKTFTQEDVERIVQDRLKGAHTKIAELSAQAQSLPAMKTQLDDLQHQLSLVGKSDADRAKAEQERIQRQVQKQIDDAKAEAQNNAKRAELAEGSLKTYVVNSALTSALALAKCVPSGVAHAAQLIAFDAKPVVTPKEDGSGYDVEMTIGQYVFKNDVPGAVAHWLKSNPHFATAPAGGTGGRQPGVSVPGARTPSLDGLDATALIQMGLGSGNGSGS